MNSKLPSKFGTLADAAKAKTLAGGALVNKIENIPDKARRESLLFGPNTRRNTACFPAPWLCPSAGRPAARQTAWIYEFQQQQIDSKAAHSGPPSFALLPQRYSLVKQFGA